jgi:hypothetical protein
MGVAMLLRRDFSDGGLRCWRCLGRGRLGWSEKVNAIGLARECVKRE